MTRARNDYPCNPITEDTSVQQFLNRLGAPDDSSLPVKERICLILKAARALLATDREMLSDEGLISSVVQVLDHADLVVKHCLTSDSEDTGAGDSKGALTSEDIFVIASLYYLGKDYVKALELFSEVPNHGEAAPELISECYRGAALCAVESGQWHEACAIMSNLSLSPDDSLNSQKIIAFAACDDLDNAMSVYNSSCNISADAGLCLANAVLKQKPAEAAKICRQQLQNSEVHNPDQQAACSNVLVLALISLNRFDEALPKILDAVDSFRHTGQLDNLLNTLRQLQYHIFARQKRNTDSANMKYADRYAELLCSLPDHLPATGQLRTDAAENFFEIGDYRNAASLYQAIQHAISSGAVSGESVSDSEISSRLSTCYYNMELYQEALNAALKNSHPSHDELRYIACIQHRLGQFRSAIDTVHSLPEDSKSTRDLHFVATLLLDEGRYEEACEELLKALDRACETSDDITESMRICLAEAYFLNGDMDKCVQTLTDLPEGIFKVRYLRGAALRCIDPDRAAQELHEASVLDPDSDALYILARHLMAQQQFDRAVCCYRKLYNQCQTQGSDTNSMNRPVKKDIREKADISPPKHEIAVNLSLCLQKTGDYREALEVHISIPDPAPGELRFRAHLYRALDNIPEALNTLEKIPESSKTPEDYLLLGRMLLSERRSDQAVKSLEKAAHSIPAAWRDLAMIYMESGLYQLALKTLKNIPENRIIPSDLSTISDLYSEIGEIDKAIDYIRLCLKHEPWNQSASEKLSSLLLVKKFK